MTFVFDRSFVDRNTQATHYSSVISRLSLVVGAGFARRHWALDIGHWEVLKAQSLETALSSSPRNKENFLPKKNPNLPGSHNQTSVLRLFSFSLLRFFFSLVAKTKRKRNEGERRKNSHIPENTEIQTLNEKATHTLFANVDPAVKPRNDEKQGFWLLALGSKLSKRKAEQSDANRNYSRFTIHDSLEKLQRSFSP